MRNLVHLPQGRLRQSESVELFGLCCQRVASIPNEICKKHGAGWRWTPVMSNCDMTSVEVSSQTDTAMLCRHHEVGSRC